MVLIPRDQTGTARDAMAALIADARIVIEQVTARQARLALDAFMRFGKGRGHPARLNYGDCFSYALAKDVGEPLLFKGRDFPHTDVMSAT